ncbi:MAG: hypothetical protein VZQ83_01795 [Eubacterium sp.]|nr:hypothetical protein [Eubacterium sp.]
MKQLYKKFLSLIILIGAILVILQFVFAYVNTFLSLDKMVTSTATSLLASTNSEIKENVNQHFERMMRIGNLIATDEQFTSYSRTDNSLKRGDQANKEITLGRLLASYTALDDFCDCAVVFNDGTTLGQVDAKTSEAYSGIELYKTFADLNDRDAQNFRISQEQDYSRIYFSKMINPSSIVLISILRESLEPIFYDAEENFNLTMHFSTPDQSIIYSGDENEMSSGKLNDDLSQVIESSSHLSIELKGTVISSDACVNNWRVTSTIPENALSSENHTLRTIYLIISVFVMIVTIVLVTLLCLQTKKRLEEFKRIEENLDEYTDIKDINLNG